MKIITGITNSRPVDESLVDDAYRQYEGKKVVIEIKRYVNTRSNQQNRYWWGCVLPLICSHMEKFGEEFTEEELHEYYKSKFYFGKKEITVNGDTIIIPKGSSECDVMEFNNAKERLQRQWAQRGLDIPDPNEQDYRLNPQE